MEHFARWIVKRRKLILVLAVLLLIPSVFGALGTYINYDILTYLPKDLDSMIGETYLEDDFNMASVSMITVENMSTPDTLKLKSDLEGVEGVQKAMWTSDFIDVTTPKEMLPSDIQKFFYNDSGATMLIVQFDAPSADARTMNAQKQIKNILNKDCFIGGMSAILEDTKSLVNEEMPLYILCAVGASLLILFLSLKETIVPLIFMLGMLFPIVYNFGVCLLHHGKPKVLGWHASLAVVDGLPVRAYKSDVPTFLSGFGHDHVGDKGRVEGVTGTALCLRLIWD